MKTVLKIFLAISIAFFTLNACDKTGQTHHGGHNGHMNNDGQHMRNNTQLHRDPVCNMQVTTNTKWKSQYKGKTYYFCMEADKKSFDKNPSKYTQKK